MCDDYYNAIFNIQPMHLDLNVLQNHIQKICNCTNFMVNATLHRCIDNNRALYTIQFSGPTVDSILQLWSDYEVHNPEGIDIGVATILLCDDINSCFTEDQETSKSSDTTVAIYFIVIASLLCIHIQ